MELPRSQQKPTTLDEALLVNEALRRENNDLRAKVVALDAQLRRLVRRVFSPGSETIPEIGQTVIPEVLVHATEQLKRELESAATTAAAAPATDMTTKPAEATVATVTAAEVAGTPAPAPALATPEVIAAVIAAAGASLPAKPKAPRGRGLKTLPDHLETVTERITLADSTAYGATPQAIKFSSIPPTLGEVDGRGICSVATEVPSSRMPTAATTAYSISAMAVWPPKPDAGPMPGVPSTNMRNCPRPWTFSTSSKVSTASTMLQPPWLRFVARTRSRNAPACARPKLQPSSPRSSVAATTSWPAR